jgi:hypothetical protein
MPIPATCPVNPVSAGILRTFDDSIDQIHEEHKGEGAGGDAVVLPC